MSVLVFALCFVAHSFNMVHPQFVSRPELTAKGTKGIDVLFHEDPPLTMWDLNKYLIEFLMTIARVTSRNEIPVGS